MTGVQTCALPICNKTIQHTVAASLEGVLPDRVTEIVIEEEVEQRRGNMLVLTTTFNTPPPLSLKFKVTVYDPLLSAEILSKQLINKVKSGDINQAFHAFVLMFGSSSLENCTFGDPRITVLNEGRHGDPMTSAEIAGLALGSFLFLVLLTVGVWLFVRWLKTFEEINFDSPSNVV